MNISLSNDLKEFVESQVIEGAYSSSSEYLRQLIREKREEARFSALILEGVTSPELNQSHNDVIFGMRQRIRDAQESAHGAG